MIHKIIPSEDNNYRLKRLNIKLNQLTNENSIENPKVVKSMNKKTAIKKL